MQTTRIDDATSNPGSLRGATPGRMGIVARVTPGVHGILRDRLGIGPELLGPRASLRDDLAVDSLDLLEVVLDCEIAFGVVVPEREIDRVRSVTDLIHVIARYVWERDRPQAFGVAA